MKTIVIAEIGENHYGQWDICRGLTQEAAKNGATIAKYQTYKWEQFAADNPELEWFKRVAMPEEVHFEMQNLCRDLGVRFMSSPFSVSAARFLVEEMHCSEVKLASRCLVQYPMLDYVNSRSDAIKAVYLSTGMGNLGEIREALSRLDKIPKLYLLHCVSQYPTDDEDANLKSITTLQKEFPGCSIGYSDHTRGIDACLVAVALGAQVLEKHFSYNTQMPGTDHAGAMTPTDLAEMMGKIERIEKMLGSGEKAPSKQEREILKVARAPMAEVPFTTKASRPESRG